MKKNASQKPNTAPAKGKSKKKSDFAKATEFINLAGKKAAQTVQESIPYVRVYEDTNTNGGIIETEDGIFTKSYEIADTNYSDAGEQRQEEILEVYEKILSSFSPNCRYEVTLFNRTIDQNAFNKKVLMEYRNDGNDELRAQHNEFLLEKMQEGKNNVRVEKYLTVAVNAENVSAAMSRFASIEKELSLQLKKINNRGLDGAILSLRDRLEILHDIYNNGEEGSFGKKFNLDDIVSQGITTKDVIAPTVMDFSHQDFIRIDDKYVRVFFLKTIPSTLSSNLLESLASIGTNSVISVHYEIQPQDKATAFASAQVTNVGGEVVKAQKALSKSGASADLISPRLRTAHDDAKMLLEELTNGNQSLFHVTLAVSIFADTMEDLKLYTEQLKTRAREHLCGIDVLRAQQEQGFDTTLPLARNFVHTHRIMTTRSASVIQPFSTQELQIKGGFYYGQNQLSKNLIIYNRGAGHNQNGVILGSPGAGKSFAAKMEMYQAYLNNKDSQIFIVDPEREYVGLAQALHATIFAIEPGGTAYINPFDLDITRDDDGTDPFPQKVDFIIAIVETMLGGHGELNGYLKSIIDNTLQELYTPYLKYLNDHNKTIDTSMCPTLKDFYNALRARKEPEAKNLAQSIQMYCTGTLNLFAHHTNVDTSNRMIVYDTKHIGTNLQELGMQICLNDIWNRMVANRARNIRTYFYVDEFYLLLRQISSARYLEMVWKRARKWQGTPTGITQNVSDLLNSEQGNTILKTSDFAMILTQSFEDRIALAQIYQISEEQQEYITNAGSGEGLIYTSNSIIPFENHVPTNRPIYKLLSTKASDDEQAVAERI